MSNLFTRWGDLDLSVDLFSGSSILFTGKKQKQTLLGHLLRALRASGDSFSFYVFLFFCFSLCFTGVYLIYYLCIFFMWRFVSLPLSCKKTGLWYKLQFVIHARVPILKVVSGHQRIACDISIDNLDGLLKSRFLFWISEIDGRFRDLVLLVS